MRSFHEVTFLVHGASAAEIERLADERCDDFFGGDNYDRKISSAVEMQRLDGQRTIWRGEVTAMRVPEVAS